MTNDCPRCLIADVNAEFQRIAGIRDMPLGPNPRIPQLYYLSASALTGLLSGANQTPTTTQEIDRAAELALSLACALRDKLEFACFPRKATAPPLALPDDEEHA
jgi:hypothetical protein